MTMLTTSYQRVLVPSTDGQEPTVALEFGRRLGRHWSAEVQVVDGGADEVVRLLEDGPPALVVLTSHGRSRAGSVLSDTADAVLRRVADPVLLVGPRVGLGSDWPAGPILICSDGTAFSESIVVPAARWARDLDLEPRLLTATEGMPRPHCVDATHPESPTGALAGMVESIIGRQVHYDVLHGDHPAALIVEHARWHRASLIALASHGRRGWSRLTSGSVTMQVLRHVGCPVLASGPLAATDDA